MSPASAPERDPAVEELLRPHRPLGLVRPSYGGRSLPNLAASILGATGGLAEGDPPLAPPLDPSIDPFRGGRADGPVVQFLIDGLGWFDFRRWALGAGARGARWASAARPITTVFPSTTTAALYSLSTAVPPGRHGLIGYRQYLPRFGVVADMLKMSPSGVPRADLLVGPDWGPAALDSPPTVFRRGVRAAVLTRDRFHSSGFTRLLYDGADLVGYATATDLAAELRRLLEGEAPPAIYVYWDELDTIQHLKGTDAELFDLELGRTLELVEHVAARLPERRAAATTLLVTGDHGQVPATPGARIAIDREPEIVREMLRPLAGDRRAGFFAARPGRLEALRAALERRLPPGSRILGVDQVLEHGLLGPPPWHAEARERLGDLVALVPSPACLTYLFPGMARPKRFLYGAHGGLEPAELIVPLVAGRLDAFRP
jgi:hypothetical protein